MAASIVKLSCSQGINNMVYGGGLVTLTALTPGTLGATVVQLASPSNDMVFAQLASGNWASVNAPHSPPPPPLTSKFSVTIDPTKVYKYENGLLYTTSQQIVPYFNYGGSAPSSVASLFAQLGTVMSTYSALNAISFHAFNIVDGSGDLVGSTLCIPV